MAKDVNFVFRLTQEERESISFLAKVLGRDIDMHVSDSDLVRRLIRRELDRYERLGVREIERQEERETAS